MRVIGILIAAASICCPAPSFGATTTGAFQIQITIDAACIISNSTDMMFGNSGVLAAQINQTSTIDVQCTNTVPYSIGLDRGLHGASVTARQMSGAGGTINYSLFRDVSRTQNWGDMIATDTVAGIGTGSPQPYTVFGRVPAQSTPAPGTYNDTITITVTY